MIIQAGTPEGNAIKTIFLDGVEVREVIELDVEEGRLIRFFTDENGLPKYDEKTGNFIEIEMKGVITYINGDIESDDPEC